jgi:adenylate kinase family enzyme
MTTMTRPAVHITGASGSGTSTLGRVLAARTGAIHFDTDDFYWLPDAPAFMARRPKPDLIRMLSEAIGAAGECGWVLSGSVGEWGAPLVPYFGLVVFLTVPTDIRIARLRAREARQFGEAAVAPGGERHEAHEEFVAWAAGYDGGQLEGRNLAFHEAWLARLPCPVLRLDGTEAVDLMVEKVLSKIANSISPSL